MQAYTLHRSEVSEFLSFSLDKAIPFVPFFVWVYMSYWLIMGIPFFIDVVPTQIHIAVLFLRFWKRRIHRNKKILRKSIRRGARIFLAIEKISRFAFGGEKNLPEARKRKIQIVLSYLFVIALSNFVYFLYPLRVVRPELHSGGNPLDITVEFLRALYEYDKPNNTLPSQHAAFSALAFFIFNRLRGTPIFFYMVVPWNIFRVRIPISAMGVLIGVWAFLIILSTYFIKQHVIVDSVAGVAVAYLAFRFGFSEWLHGKLKRLQT